MQTINYTINLVFGKYFKNENYAIRFYQVKIIAGYKNYINRLQYWQGMVQYIRILILLIRWGYQMSFDVKKKIEELNKSDIISGSNARYDIVLEEELKDLNSAGKWWH